MSRTASLIEESLATIEAAINDYPSLSMPTGLNLSGLVMLDLAAKVGFSGKVIFVDTGYHFPETIELWKSLQQRYDHPQFVTIENVRGHDEMYLLNPEACCEARKVDPLANYLATEGVDAILTGRTRHQSSSRPDLPLVEYGSRVHVNSVADWTRDDLERYAVDHSIERHQLYDLGFLSIGCWPCTRAVQPGGDERSGRFVGQGRTECGLWTKGRL